MYEVAIIGAGVVGGLTARQLSRYDIPLVILEKESDVAMGQSKANSGIVHAGFDPRPGSLMAELNVRGSQMMEQVCKELDVKYRKNGTLVLAYSREDMEHLQELLEGGIKNGVEGLKIIDGEQVRKMEKNLSKDITGALYAPTGAIVCPYELTISSIGNAMDNGAELKPSFEVISIEKIAAGKESFYRIKSADNRTVESKFVVNCGGIHSDEIAAMVGDSSFKITPRCGEYILLDKDEGDLLEMTVFSTPTKMGKGVLATKTVDGNILLGPTSWDTDDKEDKGVTSQGLDQIKEKEKKFFDGISFGKVITQFAGLRARAGKGDFIINSPCENFINAAGIESPGLSSAPAIGEKIEGMLIDMGMCCNKKENFNPYRKSVHSFKNLSLEEKNQIIKEDPSFGQVVCRCEEVTEGEIIQAIRQNPGARDVDGIKRRTRSGMGRCQGGFCLPLVMEILSRELGIEYTEVTKWGGNSQIIFKNPKGKGMK